MTQNNTQARQRDLSLSGFLSFLYRGFTDGYIYAPTFNRETEKFTQVFVKVTNLARLEAYIMESSQSADVYVSPAIFREPRATKETFLASNVVWCEFDGNSPSDFADVPSLVIQSSDERHTHCYWHLDEAVTNAFDLEEINRSLTFTMGADKSGWDCTQILRPPHTTNYKRDVPVVVQSVSGTIYNVGNFSTYQAPERLDDAKIVLEHVPDVMDVIYKHAFTDEFKSVFTSNPLEGNRSTTYVHLGYLCAEAGLSDSELYSILRNFDERVGKYRSREDRHRRLIDIIERVRLKYPTSSDEALEDSVGQVEIYDVVSFDNSEFTVDWLLSGLLQQQGSMLLSGPPGVGKTQVALNFGFGLAAGCDFLGYECAVPRRILFISCEMGPADLKYFTTRILKRYSEYSNVLKENLFVVPRGEPLYLNTIAGQDALLRMVEGLNIDGVIFDSLGSATSKSLTDEEATKGLLDFNDRFRNNTGAFSWFIHHNRKATENNKEPSGLPDVYGSQYITARATTVLSMWPVRKDIIKIRELKVRLAAAKDDWYIKREENLDFRIIPKEEAVTMKTISSKQSAEQQNRFGI